MRSASLGAVTMLLLAASVRAQEPVFHTAVEIVPVTVTVTDGAGRFLSDLDPDEFTLVENGVSQSVAVFDQGRAPVALAVVIDSSGSMEPHLSAARAAARRVLATLRGSDVASVVAFSDEPALLAGFTRDGTALHRALEAIEASGTTSLFDAVALAADRLQELPPRTVDGLRRSVILVLSDGTDTSSRVTLDAATARVRASGATVYSIHRQAGNAGSRIGRMLSQTGRAWLASLSAHTGGRLFEYRAVEDLETASAEIARELNCQYLLAYSPAGTAQKASRQISVRVRRPNLVVRVREGYGGRVEP